MTCIGPSVKSEETTERLFVARLGKEKASMGINELPINMIEDFPVISRIYKDNFATSDSHLLTGARITPRTYIEELSESILQDGLHHPILVRQKDHSYQIISGHIRKYAFKQLGRDTIPVKIIEVDDILAKAMLITTNRFQHPLDAIEEAWVVQDLIENEKRSLKECASILNTGRTWVHHRYLLATKLVKEIQLDIAMGLISPRAAIEIAGVHTCEQQKIATAVKERKLSFIETTELIKIIKDKYTSDRIKELALDDPCTVINKLSQDEKVFYTKSELSYFASNFREEVYRLSSVSLEVIHRIKRDFARFSESEQKVLLKDLGTVNKRIKELSKLLKEIHGKESDL